MVLSINIFSPMAASCFFVRFDPGVLSLLIGYKRSCRDHNDQPMFILVFVAFYQSPTTGPEKFFSETVALEHTMLICMHLIFLLHFLDRLFALLENCPNASLRATAAEQLGEVARNCPSNIDYVFTRHFIHFLHFKYTCIRRNFPIRFFRQTKLIPLLRHKNWISRIAASEAIRSIVRHLPDWNPTLQHQSNMDRKSISVNGFLSLSELRIDCVLAQGARLYSMDARELDKSNKRSVFDRCIRNDEGTMECDVCEPQTDIHSPQVLPSVQRQEINNRLGLGNDSMLTQVLETHADVSISDWITPDDLNDEAQPGFTQLDVEACVRSTYVVTSDTDKKRTSPCQSLVQCDAKRIKLDSLSDVALGKFDLDAQATTAEHNQYSSHWPLDKVCTTLLGDLWALRWETRHGAASGLRELLSEPKHTRQAGKHFGQSLIEMDASHYQYLEDIVVRVLCTLALDQLSDFISDEVVAPVRETAAQLLGVLSLHLTIEQVLLVTKHLIFLASLNDETVTQLCSNMPCHKNSTNISKNSWMIAHGGLLGIKYLLAARKDLKDSLLPHVTPCLISRLFGIPITIHTQSVSQPRHNPLTLNVINAVSDDEDMRAAAASALLPIVDAVWIESLSQYEYNLFVNHVWSLIHNTPSDLSPSTGPVLSLVCALTKAEWERRQSVEKHISMIKSEENVSTCQIDINTKIIILIELLHHVTSSIRQSALTTLQCVVESCEDKVASLSVDTLQVILDNLLLRILLESCASIRAIVTSLAIKIIQSAQTDCLVQASIRRLDIWLCQVMQPTGIPYPNKFLVPCLKSSDVQLSTSGSNASNDEMSHLPVKSTINADSHITSGNQSGVFIPQHAYCIGGFQCLTTSRSEMESYVLETRISAVRGVLTIVHCKSLLQTVNEIVHSERQYPQHKASCVIDSSLFDRLYCQFEKTQNTVDHCLTLQLYLGNRMNWILPGRLSLLIRPLMDTIRCMKPYLNQPSNATSTTTATTPLISVGSNNNNSGSSSVVGGNAFIDLLPIGTCVYLQRLAACCLARLLWLEWRMLLSARHPPSSALIIKNSLLPNTSKAAAKVIKNLTSYLMEFDPEGNHQSNEDLSLVEAKIACGNPLSTYRLDMATATSSLSFEAQCQSSQYRGAYIALSCICYTFITLYHYEEVNDACRSSSASLSPCVTLKSYDHHLSNSSLNSLRFGIPSLWHLFWINPVKIIINLYSQLGILMENGKYMEGGEMHVTNGSSYSILRKLTNVVKVNISKVNVIDLPKSTHDELLAGLVVLSTCLNVILPCIDPDREENSCYKQYDISFEQIIWLGSLVIRLPRTAYHRVGARLLANLTLLRPVHTLNILLSLLLFSNSGTFLPTDSSMCIGTLETFLSKSNFIHRLLFSKRTS
ncbi:TATA-binding protein-associated factor [Schistosoma japonicum]|nr:TATA-binding protein-associated factor [Schistosoma japonicum]